MGNPTVRTHRATNPDYYPPYLEDRTAGEYILLGRLVDGSMKILHDNEGQATLPSWFWMV